jgi:hypothetical protein
MFVMRLLQLLCIQHRLWAGMRQSYFGEVRGFEFLGPAMVMALNARGAVILIFLGRRLGEVGRTRGGHGCLVALWNTTLDARHSTM